MEATSYRGEGIVVVADDPELDWPNRVLANLQMSALSSGFFVQRLMPQVHSYHLDDAPDLRSCNVLLRAVSGDERVVHSQPIREADRLTNFYGRDHHPRVRYVREKVRLAYGKAHDDEYSLELDAACEEYGRFYNGTRPHEAIDFAVPSTATSPNRPGHRPSHTYPRAKVSKFLDAGHYTDWITV